MSDRPAIPCGCCHGRGFALLAPRYTATFDLLRKQREPLNGAALAKLAGCRNEAMCNRLRGLEKHGLAKAERRGREVLWVAKRSA